MAVYRKAKPEERDAYVRFANMVFNDAGDPVKFDTDLPKVYGPDVDASHLQNIAVDDEKGIRGLVAVLPGELYAGGETLRTGFVGTVSVHPEARGEGHMKRLMGMALAEMRENGTDFSMLHGRRQRYEYFGFAQGGVDWKFDVSRSCVQHALKMVDADGISFEEITADSAWVAEAEKLHRQGLAYYRRDSFVLDCMSFIHRPWAILKGGLFEGYLVCNSKKNAIAEICVRSTDDLDAALKAWTSANETGVTVVLPEWECEMARHLAAYAEFTQMEPNVHVQVFNFRKVIRALLRLKSGYSRLSDGRLCLEADGDRFTVVVEDGQPHVEEGGQAPICLSALDANRLLAYPFDYEGRPDAPAGWFPLPFFCPVPDQF